MEPKAFIELLEGADLEVRSYSGRGMGGDQCVAVTIGASEVTETILDIVSEADKNQIHIQTIVDYLRGGLTDSMGLDIVLYWPDVEWPEDATEA